MSFDGGTRDYDLRVGGGGRVRLYPNRVSDTATFILNVEDAREGAAHGRGVAAEGSVELLRRALGCAVHPAREQGAAPGVFGHGVRLQAVLHL